MLSGKVWNVFDMNYYFPVEPSHIYKFEDVFLKLPTLVGKEA